MPYQLFVSNAESGTISCYELDSSTPNTTEKLRWVTDVSAAPLVMPMTIDEKRALLYAVIRSKPYRLLQYRIEPQGLSLTQEWPLSASMANIELSPDGLTAYSVSFADNLWAQTRLQDASNNTTDWFPCGSHPHAIHISPDKKWLIHSELGSDKLQISSYGAEHGEPRNINVTPKSGPRHFVFSPAGDELYLLTEMSGEVIRYRIEAAGKDNISPPSLIERERCAILPFAEIGLAPGLAPEKRQNDDQPRVWAADIHLTHNGRFLYTSERTTSRISLFEIDAVSMRYVSSFPVESCPRSFAITPDDQWLSVTGEQASVIGLYAINSATGYLKRECEAPCGKGANWVSIVAKLEQQVI